MEKVSYKLFFSLFIIIIMITIITIITYITMAYENTHKNKFIAL